MLILLLPVALVLLAVLAIVAWCLKAKAAAVALLVVGVLLNWFGECVAFHLFSDGVSKEKEDGVVRVMTYNIHRCGEYVIAHKDSVPHELLQCIESMNVDVLVINELTPYYESVVLESIAGLFPYNSFDLTEEAYNTTHVFSRFPLENCTRLQYTDHTGMEKKSDSWMMEVNAPSGRFYLTACHLPSNNYVADTVRVNSVGGERGLMVGLRKGYAARATAVEALRDSLDRCTLPMVVAGDFNDIGGSNAVSSLKGDDLHDAWWEGGLGYGHTYHDRLRYFRLDHILYSKKHFTLQGVSVMSDWQFSDHYPLVVDLIPHSTYSTYSTFIWV